MEKTQQDIKAQILKIDSLIEQKAVITKKITQWCGWLLEKVQKRQAFKLRKDRLGRTPHAKNIAKEINDNFGEHSDGYIFAISGKWGEGKTDLLMRIKPELIKKGFDVVLFSPWQYTQDAETLRRAFLQTLNKELKRFRPLWRRFLWSIRNRNTLDPFRYDLSKTDLNWEAVLVCILIALNTGVAIVFLGLLKGASLGQAFENLYASIKSLALIALSAPLLSALVTVVFAILAAPQLFQIKRTSRKISSVDDFEKVFFRILTPHQKVVIFIDDLDRCTPRGVKLVLDSLKTFFRTSEVSYVITGDHSVLERYLGKELEVRPKFKPDGEIDEESTKQEEILEGKRFLQKLFNVYWRLPQPDPSYSERLAKYHLGRIRDLDKSSKDKILGLIVNFLGRNPRDIERFVKMLAFSLQGINTRVKSIEKKTQRKIEEEKVLENLKAVRNHPSLLAKVLLIQEKYDEEFYEYSKQPSRYALLEREQIKNKPGAESNQSQTRLKNRAVDFFALVKTEPRFHNERLALENSPDVFFYYSGFAGSAEKGVLNEDFLNRYIVADSELLADVKGSSESRIKEIIPTSISHLNQLSDQAQINQAIVNLRDIFVSDIPAAKEFLDDFMTNSKVVQYWDPLPDDQKESFLKNLAKAATEGDLQEPFKKFFSDDPWKSKKESVWNSISTHLLSNALLDVLVEDALGDQQAGVDITPKKQKVLNEHMQILLNPQKYSEEELEKTTTRLNNLQGKLDFQALINKKLFKQILVAIRSEGLKQVKKILLLKFLRKDEPIWGSLPRPTNELRLLNPRSKLRKSEIGGIVKEIYETWYPSSRKISKKRIKRPKGKRTAKKSKKRS